MIRLSSQDLDSFRLASRDANPLHASDAYARKTPYGGRVAFGVLVGLLALARVGSQAGRVLFDLSFEFQGVAQPEIDYAVEVNEISSERTRVRVVDGRRPILEATLTFRPGELKRGEQIAGGDASRTESADLIRSDLSVGQIVEGRYAPDWPMVDALIERAGLHQTWISRGHIAALLWASYFVGMEIPGRRALFSTLQMRFNGPAEPIAPFDYRAKLASLSAVGEMRVDATLAHQGIPVAAARIGAYLRSDSPESSIERIEEYGGRSEALAGKVALVVGASRGLGASLAQAFAVHGCTVLATFLSSREEIERVCQSVAGASGEIVPIQGDAADSSWCQKLAEEISERYGQLDFLVCNACPPIQPLWIEPDAEERIVAFVERGFRLVARPMIRLLPLVAKFSGWNVLISSAYVSESPVYFGHYVAMKSAAESLVDFAGREYRAASHLVVRPPKLITDQTNTPIAARGAMPTEFAAAQIVARLRGVACPGKVELLEDFPMPPMVAVAGDAEERVRS